MRRAAFGLVIAAVMAVPLPASQKFVTGLFTATEDGTPVELIAWATSMRSGVLRMENGSLEDAPVLPRTYRFLMNMGIFKLVAVYAVTAEVFKKPLDQLEYRTYPYSNVKLGVDTSEIGVPFLENWDNVVRLRKSLKATEDNPLIFFLVVSNGTITRLYPFFIDRQ